MDLASDEVKGEDGIALCASCDRCRSRKTKCDGLRPCSNCAAKYMKKHKLNSIAPDLFECIYSPAKRRGPVPGRTTQQGRKSETNLDSMASASHVGGGGNNTNSSNGMANADWGTALQQQQQQQAANPLLNSTMANLWGHGDLDANPATAAGASALQQLSLLSQLHSKQQQQQQQQQQLQNNGSLSTSIANPNSIGDSERPTRRVKLEEATKDSSLSGIPRTVQAHAHLLERNNPEGTRLLAYYKLSIDELFRLPPTLTDDEYCKRVGPPGFTPNMIPGTHVAALSAARFAEVALGAIVHNEVSLAMELCNAVVHCLRESVQEPVGAPVMFEVAKAYFLLGVFRAFRGDIARYLKYRRVCLTYVAKLEHDEKAPVLLAAISYLDSWAYMVYNASEKDLPNVDGTIAAVGPGLQNPFGRSAVELKYGVKTNARAIATDPQNKNWIQGAPPVYLNNEAPLHSRALDALACAVRQCCDQANSRFSAIAKAADNRGTIRQESIMTPTATAILANENELCSRNIVLSAYTLMQQLEAQSKGTMRNEGLHLVISAMDAFLENTDDGSGGGGGGGFTDSQIQSLLTVCNTALENPFLLHHAGPTYHMVSNAATLLCHLLNGMYAMKGSGQFGPMEATMFEEVLDTFIAIRKMLTVHRRKLPVKLRCHGLARPNLAAPFKEGQPLIDLGETLLCACRGCQGFVLMACSPCVAAERALAAEQRLVVEASHETEAVELGELDRELEDIGAEFDVDDDALLNIISSLVAN